MSNNPAYPDADPTAPGGMSRKQLAAELRQVHGWDTHVITEKFADPKTWPKMIDAVIQERKNREREIKSVPLAGNEQNILFLGMPDSKDYIFDGHAGAGPSGAERWMSCTASLGAARAFLETLTPNQQAEFAKAGTAARQGTTAHAVAEAEARLLLGEITDAELNATLMQLSVEPDTAGEAYDDEMAEYISEYTALIQSFVAEGREVLIEKRVTATIELTTVDADGEYNLHDISGSADLIVVPEPEHPVLVVGDLKYGEGIDVDVTENSQVRIYGLGALAEVVERYDGLPDWLTEIEYVIAQPRRGGIKTWAESIDSLLDWQDTVLAPALTEALGGLKEGARFSPSDKACQWCPARGTCPALAESRMAAASELFDVIQETEIATRIEGAFPETESLDSERLASLYSQITGLVSIADDMKAEINRRLQRGAEVPGYHLVNYQPPRHWTEEAALELDPANRDEGVLTEAQAAQLWTEKLVTPTAAEKILGDDFDRIKDLVVKPDVRPVPAPVTDRRKAWTGVPPEQMFTVVEGEK